ncbi:hypothetical protein [Ferruginibacter sp.]
MLDNQADKRNSQRDIFDKDILKRLNETKKGMVHKTPWLYEIQFA